MRTYIVRGIDGNILWTGQAKNIKELRAECLSFRLSNLLHTVRYGKKTYSASEIYAL